MDKVPSEVWNADLNAIWRDVVHQQHLGLGTVMIRITTDGVEVLKPAEWMSDCPDSHAAE